MYDLSILSKLMSICPLIVRRTQVLGFIILSAETYSRRIGGLAKGIEYGLNYLWRGLVTPIPDIMMSLLNVLGIILEKFEVTESIIGFITIYVMNFFRFLKSSSEVLLHYIAMFKYSPAVYINPHIAERGQASRPFLEIRPVGGYIETLVASPPRPVHLTYPPLLWYVLTAIDPTGFHANNHIVRVM